MSFVLAHGEIHDWIIFTPDGAKYWPQIDRELVFNRCLRASKPPQCG